MASVSAMSMNEEVINELDFSWVMEWDEQLTDSLFIFVSRHTVERKTGSFMTATNELKDHFFEERIRTLSY